MLKIMSASSWSGDWCAQLPARWDENTDH